MIAATATTRRDEQQQRRHEQRHENRPRQRPRRGQRDDQRVRRPGARVCCGARRGRCCARSPARKTAISASTSAVPATGRITLIPTAITNAASASIRCLRGAGAGRPGRAAYRPGSAEPWTGSRAGPLAAGPCAHPCGCPACGRPGGISRRRVAHRRQQVRDAAGASYARTPVASAPDGTGPG